MRMKLSSAECRPYCSGLTVIITLLRLGYGAGAPHSFGSGGDEVGLENIDCFGDETDLLYCTNGGTRLNGDTNHNDDVGVKCFPGNINSLPRGRCGNNVKSVIF